MTDKDEEKTIDPAENTAPVENADAQAEEKGNIVQGENKNTPKSSAQEFVCAAKESAAVQEGRENITSDTEIPMDGTFVQQDAYMPYESGKSQQQEQAEYRAQTAEKQAEKTATWTAPHAEPASPMHAGEPTGQNMPQGQPPMPAPPFSHVSQETWGSLLSLAVSFLGIFCLLNVNIAFVASNMASRSLLTFNFVTIGAVSFLTALINTFLPGRRKGYVLWIASAVAFAAAVLIQW